MSSLQLDYPESPPYGSYATPSCGGGLCYSVGLKRCVVCGSTAKPRCNLTSSICKSANRTATSCSVTSNCVCNCKFPSGKTSLQYAKESVARNYKTPTSSTTKKLNCNLSPKLCLANNPRAKSCGVRLYKNGSCVCDCVDSVTGKSYLPIPQPGTVERTVPHVTSTDIKPGVIPKAGVTAAEMESYFNPVWLTNMQPGLVKDILSTLNEIWVKLIYMPNLYGQPIGPGLKETLFGVPIEQYGQRLSLEQRDYAFKACPICVDAYQCQPTPYERFKCENMIAACNKCGKAKKLGSF